MLPNPANWDLRHRVSRARTRCSLKSRRSVAKVRAENLTYLDRGALIDLATLARRMGSTRGVILEAGSALGGSAIVLAAAKAQRTPLHLYDVFGTIPPPTDADGEAAARRFEEIAAGKSAGIGGDVYYGYRSDLVDRELTFRENVQHFAPDIARRAHDCDPITHFVLRFADAPSARGWINQVSGSQII